MSQPDITNELEEQTSEQEKRKETSEEEAPIQAVKGDGKPQETDVLQGFFIELTESGEVRRKFYGKQQNITYMLGLAEFMKLEIEQRQKLQKGFLPSAELSTIVGLTKIMQNIGNVLIQMQGTMGGISNMIKALPDEFRKAADLEGAVGAESQQE